MSKHTEQSAVSALKKKGDVRIDTDEKLIFHLVGDRAFNDLGNGSWGKMDFLVNHAGYRKLKVTEFQSRR